MFIPLSWMHPLALDLDRYMVDVCPSEPELEANRTGSPAPSEPAPSGRRNSLVQLSTDRSTITVTEQPECGDEHPPSLATAKVVLVLAGHHGKRCG